MEVAAGLQNPMSIEIGQNVRMRNQGGHWQRGFVVSTDPLLVDVTRNGLGLIWEEVEPTFDPLRGPEARRREIFGQLGYLNRSSSGPPALMDARYGHQRTGQGESRALRGELLPEPSAAQDIVHGNAVRGTECVRQPFAARHPPPGPGTMLIRARRDQVQVNHPFCFKSKGELVRGTECVRQP